MEDLIEKAGIPKCDELNDIKELMDKFGAICKKRPIIYEHYLIKRNNFSIELLRKIIEKYGYTLSYANSPNLCQNNRKIWILTTS